MTSIPRGRHEGLGKATREGQKGGMEMEKLEVKCPTLQALRELERALWENDDAEPRLEWERVYDAILDLLHRDEVGSIGLLL